MSETPKAIGALEQALRNRLCSCRDFWPVSRHPADCPVTLIRTAIAKLDELQAENERLTRERDEAKAAKVLAERYAARVDEARRTAERERDEALAAMNADVADVVLAKCVAEARAALAEAEEPKPAPPDPPPPVCTGSGTPMTDAAGMYSMMPTTGRCGICGQTVLLDTRTLCVAVHPWREPAPPREER